MESNDKPSKSLRKRYLDAIVAGDRATSTEVLEACLAAGLPIDAIYLSVFAPALREVGSRWAEGRLNTAQEHLASQITLEQMERVRRTIQVPKPLGRRILLTTVEGDAHWIGARMAADLFMAAGWEVDFLGADTPVEDLLEFTRQRQPDLVVLSASLPEHLPALRESVRALRRLEPPVKAMVGGAAVSAGPEDAMTFGADAVALTLPQAVEQAALLAAGPSRGIALQHYLKRLGKRVQQRRRARGWSQQKLAEASGLNRTYVSAVERGGQNLSLGALVRLAAALETSPEELLGEPLSG